MLRRWQVVAVKHNGDAVQVLRKSRGRFGIKKGRRKMGQKAARNAARWAQSKGWETHRTRSRYPFLVLDSDTRWPRRKPTRRLNKAARQRRRYFYVNEGWRTHARQWQLWRAYQAGGTLAAYPGTSRHESGNAIDVQVISRGRSGGRLNIGDDSKARSIAYRLGFRWTVPGEPWHIVLVGT